MRRSARGVVVEFAELSDPGREPSKQVNEDASGYAETAHGHLAVVCDGMGGHAGGREASEAAIRTIMGEVTSAAASEPAPAALTRAIEAAGRAVYAVGGPGPQELRPGSTAVALLLHEAGAELCHVGDSRAYLVRGSVIQRLTRDHSMVQEMVDAGVLRPEDAPMHPEANKITRALGMAAEVEVETAPKPAPITAGDTLLLATDGLTDLVSDAEILGVVKQRIALGPAVVCQDLVALANERGGHDNVTVQVVHVLELPPQRARAPDPTQVDVGEPGRSPSGTLPGETLVEHPPARTEPGQYAQPSPTLLDEGYAGRTTQPGQAPAAPAAPYDDREAPPRAGARQARALVLLGAAVAIVILLGVTIWWAVGAWRKRQLSEDPPPEPTVVAFPAPAPLTSVAPEREPLSSDAGAPLDAGRDAAARETGAPRVP
jgi:PPM family protein phosphatase